MKPSTEEYPLSSIEEEEKALQITLAREELKENAKNPFLNQSKWTHYLVGVICIGLAAYYQSSIWIMFLFLLSIIQSYTERVHARIDAVIKMQTEANTTKPKM